MTDIDYTSQNSFTNMSSKTLYVFLAFDKVGSTSIRHEMSTSSGKKKICDPYFDGDICFSDISNHYINANAMPRANLTSYFSKCKLFDRQCTFFTILRNPLARIYSAYSYFCKSCAEHNRQCNNYFKCPNTDIVSYAQKIGNVYNIFFSNENFVLETKFIILEKAETFYILNEVGLNNNLVSSNMHPHTNEFCDDNCTNALRNLFEPDFKFYNNIVEKSSSLKNLQPPRLPPPGVPRLPQSSTLLQQSLKSIPHSKNVTLLNDRSIANTGSFLILFVAMMLWCGVIPTIVRSVTYARSEFRMNKSAIVSFLLLVTIAISKTILTKHIFEHIDAPVAMSALSCIVTTIMLVPVCITQRTLHLLTIEESKTLAFVCITVAADLAFTNVGLSILPIAFQQAIKSTIPVATIAVEFLIYGKCVSRASLAVIVGICLGPITMALDKSWSSDSDIVYGVIMLSLSIFAGACKYVLAHSAINRFKKTLGIVGFTLWMEIFATVFILPWSIANGEISVLLEHSSNWLLLIGTAAFGGVRILAQFLFLEKTSPTTLAASNIVIQVGLTAAGSVIFHDSITLNLVLGTLITIVMSASYTFVKSSELTSLKNSEYESTQVEEDENQLLSETKQIESVAVKMTSNQ
jgi:drug/metabolite transporter (DMT)-like permease